MDNLNTRVQSLPAELFHEIYIHTFTASSSLRTIDKDYKPPHLLQVNRHSRALFAKSYYGSGSIFCTFLDVLQAWMRHIQRTHAEQIGEIRLGPYVSAVETEFYVAEWAIEVAEQTMRELGVCGAQTWDELFKVHMGLSNGEKEWMNYCEIQKLR